MPRIASPPSAKVLLGSQVYCGGNFTAELPIASSIARHDDFSSPAGPAIDLVHLARQTMDDPALETELLEMFDRQSASLIAQLKRDDVADARACVEIAHKLRGSALALGAARVAAAAQALEDRCAAGGSDNAPLIDALDAAVEQARTEIADLRR